VAVGNKKDAACWGRVLLSLLVLPGFYLKRNNLLSRLRPEWVGKKIKVKAVCNVRHHVKHVIRLSEARQPWICFKNAQ